MKEEYPPLLTPGFHDVKSEQLEEVFCTPFQNSDRRRYLLQRLQVLLREVHALGISYELWIDGSYATEKEEPNDIDILFVLDQDELNALNARGQQAVTTLLGDHNRVKLRYQCDMYVCLAQDEPEKSYWRGWFGFSRGEQVKGIARIRYTAA